MRGKNTSARMVLIKILCIFLIPFLLFILLLNVYCNTVYIQRLAQNNRTRLEMYESFIEEDLEHVQYFMSDMIANDGTFAAIRYPLSEVNSYLQGQVLKEKFESVMKSIDGITAFCVLSSRSNFFSGTYAREITYVEKENIQSYLQGLVSEEGKDVVSDWRIQQIGEEYYFIKIMGQGHAYCSCLIAANNLSRQQDDSYLLFENSEEFISYGSKMEDLGVKIRKDRSSYRSGNSRNQFVVQEYFDLLHANILLVEEYHGIWSFSSLPVMMVIISLFFAVLILLCYRLLKKSFLSPLEEMVETMEQIRDGEAGSRLKIASQVQEFRKIDTTFNSMMDRIRKLKLLAYDRLIQMQQTQLQYYQIQIRPHFYLNCLKTLYGMASSGNYGQLREMILTMSDYLRLVMKDHDVSIPLRRELDSIRAFIRLQQLSNARPPELYEEISERLEDYGIPPISILSYVENSLRYKRDDDTPLKILIRVQLLENEEEQMVNITIQDNGIGFPREILDVLNDPEQRLSEEHLGIHNIEQRFSLLFQNKCSFFYSNMEGACVEIFLPYEKEEEHAGLYSEQAKGRMTDGPINCR